MIARMMISLCAETKWRTAVKIIAIHSSPKEKNRMRYMNKREKKFNRRIILRHIFKEY